MTTSTVREMALRSPEMKRILWRVGLALLAVFLLLGGIKFWQISAAIAGHASFSPPPEAVTSMRAEQSVWQPALELVGSLNPSRGVTISAEVGGTVARIGFESGADVKQGDLLVQLDTGVEQAQLRSAEAMHELARVKLARAQKLRAQSAVSEQELNDAVAEEHRAAASADELKATIAKKTIVAPFSGRTGIRMVNVGEFIKEGVAVVPLHALNPLFLDFSVPQQQVMQLKLGQQIHFAVDVYPGATFEGAVTAIDPQIDPVTRNVRVQATIQNPEEKLRPGMFARVSLILNEKQQVLAIPSSSINYAPYGNSIYVIEKMKNPKGEEYLGVRQQFVRLGKSQGDLVAVLEGLKPGEEVVTSGVFKLRPGAAVQVNNSVMPGSDAAPNPADT